MAKAKQAVPDGYQTLTPMLTFEEARKALDWYKQALGAQELFCATSPDGQVMHAELQLGSSRVMVHDAMMGAKGPKALGGSPAGLWVFVEDCDALFNRAVAAGAKVTMPMGDQFWGDRCGNIQDPFGYGWTIATRKEDLTPQEMKEREAAFYKEMAAGGPGPK